MSALRLRFMAATTAAVVTVSLASLARADAPAGHYTASGGIVTDTRTGLDWQQVMEMTGTEADAVDYCASLDLGGTGWRLPSMKELETIVDDSRYKPAIDPIFSFFGTASSSWRTWSSSPLYGLEQAYGWFVDFTDGSAWYQYLVEKGGIRCVR